MKFFSLVLLSSFLTLNAFTQSVLHIWDNSNGKEFVLKKGKRIVFEQASIEGRFKGKVDGFEGDNIIVNGKKVEVADISFISFNPFSLGAKIGLSMITVLSTVGISYGTSSETRIFISPGYGGLFAGIGSVHMITHKKNFSQSSDIELRVVDKSTLKPQKL